MLLGQIYCNNITTYCNERWRDEASWALQLNFFTDKNYNFSNQQWNSKHKFIPFLTLLRYPLLNGMRTGPSNLIYWPCHDKKMKTNQQSETEFWIQVHSLAKSIGAIQQFISLSWMMEEDEMEASRAFQRNSMFRIQPISQYRQKFNLTVENNSHDLLCQWWWLFPQACVIPIIDHHSIDVQSSEIRGQWQSSVT